MKPIFFATFTAIIILAGAGCSSNQIKPVSPPTDSGSGLSYGYDTQKGPDEYSSNPDAPTSAPISPSQSQSLSLTQKLSLTKPAMEIDTTKQYSAILHTGAGDITIAFNKGATPVTVNNFVTLAKKGFYDNTIFHRTIAGFMIQGGDPKGDGPGGPGYRFDDEPFTGEYTRGTVAMANAGPNTNGSQFFIMHADYPLPKNYVIFGHVTGGMDVVDKIATAPNQPYGEGSTPVNPVTVKSVEITEK